MRMGMWIWTGGIVWIVPVVGVLGVGWKGWKGIVVDMCNNRIRRQD